MQNIILTIGISVYNGEDTIGRTLDSLLSQSSAYNEVLEVLISDNASTDGTPQIINEYSSKNPGQIKVFRNGENLKYDSNVDLVVKRASGRYVWFLGCGEVVKKDCLGLIIEKIKNENYDNILLNFDIYSDKLGSIEYANLLKAERDKTFTDREKFLSECLSSLAVLSANIVSVKAWRNISGVPLFAKGWCHLERILAILNSKDYKSSLLISRTCFIQNREENGWWASHYFVNYLSFRKIVENMEKSGIPSEAIDKYLDRKSSSAFLKIIYFGKVLERKFNYNLLPHLVNVFGNKILFWLIGLPMLLVPNSFYKTSLFRNLKILYDRIKSNYSLRHN